MRRVLVVRVRLPSGGSTALALDPVTGRFEPGARLFVDFDEAETEKVPRALERARAAAMET